MYGFFSHTSGIPASFPLQNLRSRNLPLLLIAGIVLLPGCGGDAGSGADNSAANAATSEVDPTMAVTDGGGGGGMLPEDGAMPGGGGGAGYGGGMDSGHDAAMGMDTGAMTPGAEGMLGDASGGGAGYAGMPGAEGYGNPYGGGQPRNARPARPAAVESWTDEQFADAIRERDAAVLAAIDQKVKSAPGDASVAQLLSSLLATSLEVPKQNNPYGASDPYGGGYPGGYPGDPSEAPAGFIEPDPGTNPTMGSGQSFGNPGAGYPGMGPAPGAISTPGQTSPNSSPASGIPGDAGTSISSPPTTDSSEQLLEFPFPPERSSVVTIHHGAVDSMTAMVLEASVTFLQASSSKGMLQSQPEPAGSSSAAGLGAAGLDPGMTMPATDPAAGAMPGYGGAAGYGGMPEYGGAAGYGGMPGAGNQTAGKLQDQQLVKAIIEGLIRNNSTEAWQTIHGILLDQVKTPLNSPENCHFVTEALFRHLDNTGGPASQTLTAIIEGTAPLPPVNRSACLQIVASVSAAAADKLIGIVPEARPAPARQGGGMMAGGGFAGAGGYMGDMPGGVDDMYSGNPGMMDGYPGAAGDPAMAGGANRPVPAGQPLPPVELDGNALGTAAAFLWNPAMVKKVIEQLRSAPDPTMAVDLITLCASIPHTGVRNELLQAFSRVQPVAADAFMASGLFQHNSHDPGMLVVLKSLPRPRPVRNAANAPPAPMEPWTMASQQLVLALRDRLRRSAASLPRYDGTQLVRLHKNAIPEISVALALPGAAKDFLGEAAPADTKVYYTRMSFTPASQKEQSQVADHYEERASGQRRADQQKGILWIDGLRVMSTGERRTMDVIIQRAAGNTPGGYPGGGGGGFEGAGGPGGAPGEKFTIEVIVVETIDPKTTAADVTTTSAN